MPVSLEGLFREVHLLSDEKMFELNARKPGAYLGLQALEHAYMNLQVYKKFGVDNGELSGTISNAYQVLYSAYKAEVGGQRATLLIKQIDKGVDEALARIVPAQGRERD